MTQTLDFSSIRRRGKAACITCSCDKTGQDKDNEIFSEPLHADAGQRARLNRQMMGGSQQTQPTKYNLLSDSIIHLLHSDQFVLINPHEGTVSETKAPEEQ